MVDRLPDVQPHARDQQEGRWARLPRMEVKRDKSSQMRFQLIWCPLYS